MTSAFTPSDPAREGHKRGLAPLTALLLLAGVAAWPQQGPSFDEETAHIAQALALESGLTVADVGAGKGRYTVFLADAVGPTGSV
ncbi:MAG: hypothetical protein OEN22_07635, partial [Gammaproteobacteria bacterium]|nr:hypothetical protein [Gammaproteobacteria bacterium]